MAIAKIMLVKYERGVGGAHSEMGQIRINPVNKRIAFSAWIGTGNFGKSVFEGTTYEMVDIETGNLVDISDFDIISKDGSYHIQSTSGQLIDVRRLASGELRTLSHEHLDSLLNMKFENRYSGEY